jgi:quercetin dioxygenase-like cupin family protein
MFKSALVFIASASTMLAAAAAAEDAVTADPKHYQVEFENDRVRVIRVTYAPGEKSVMHTHAPYVSVAVSDIDVRMHLPDGSHVEAKQKKGTVSWAESEEHLPENIGDQPFEVVLVELKGTN